MSEEFQNDLFSETRYHFNHEQAFAATDPLEKWRQTVINCTKCRLGTLRLNAVFGEGHRHAKLMFIGEAPGANEDAIGRPFVGRAGQLLTSALEANGVKRADVFITNIVKCRPPKNRDPLPDEIASCSPYLFRQIELIQPEMLCTLGRYAAATLLARPVKITQEHGRWIEFKGLPLLIALHPSAALRSVKFKEQFEHDIKTVAERFHGIV